MENKIQDNKYIQAEEDEAMIDNGSTIERRICLGLDFLVCLGKGWYLYREG